MWNLSKTTPSVPRVAIERVAEGSPHVHRCHFDPQALFRAQSSEEEVEVGFCPPAPADPNRATSVEIADDDAILVPLANGDLIASDGPGRRHPRTSHLLGHVELVQVLDRSVVQSFRHRYGLVGHLATERSDVQGVPSRVPRILRQPIHPLYEHGTTPRAVDAPTLELQIDPPTRRRQIPNSTRALVVSAMTPMPAAGARCRFFRRRRTTIRAYRSPNTPCRPASATNPGSEKRALRDLGCFTAPDYRDQTRRNFFPADSFRSQLKTRPSGGYKRGSDPLKSAETLFL